MQTVEAGGETDISVSSPDEATVVLSGTIAADSAPVVKIWAFADPATFARTAFIEALGRAGVSVTADPVADNPAGSLPDPAAVEALPSVAELESLPLEEEATYVLKISYNRGAETLICRLAVAAGSTDCPAAGQAKAAEIWRAGRSRHPRRRRSIDGSGLPGNLITADNQVQLQTLMAERPDAERWRSALPLLGVDGSPVDGPGGRAGRRQGLRQDRNPRLPRTCSTSGSGCRPRRWGATSTLQAAGGSRSP